MYRCRKPARPRFYDDGAEAIVNGKLVKLGVRNTWACDECWFRFLRQLDQH